MSTPDFEQLLKRPVGDAKRPPALPAGTGFGSIKGFAFGQSRFADEATGEKHAIVTFTIVPTRMEERLAEEVAALVPPLNERQLRAELPLSGGNEWITRMFLESLGLDVKRSWAEIVPETVGHEVMFAVTQRMDKNNPEIIYNDIRSLRKAVG